MVDSVNTEEPDDFAARLKRLFAAVRREDGEQWSVPQAAEAVTARGHRVSKQYLYDLLRREKTEPSHSLVRALASFFGVTLDFFADTARGHELNRQFETLASLGESQVSEILYRAGRLPPDEAHSVLDYIAFIEQRSQARHRPET